MRGFWRAFRRNRLALIGGIVVVILVVLAALAPRISPWDPNRPDVRKILEDTAKETQAFVYQTAEKDDSELLDKLKAAGMQVNNANKDSFIAASRPVYDEFARDVPGSKEVIDRAIALGK